MNVYDDPFRLRVKMAITASLSSISTVSGYKHDLAGKVFRGRDIFGQNDPLPAVAILEELMPVEPLQASTGSAFQTLSWNLLIQGFVTDDFENPTDPAHRLMADVKRKLGEERKRKGPRGEPNPFNMGSPQLDGRRSVGNVVEDLIIGPGVVRPPDAGISDKAYFYLGLTLKIVEDISQPFL